MSADRIIQDMIAAMSREQVFAAFDAIGVCPPGVWRSETEANRTALLTLYTQKPDIRGAGIVVAWYDPTYNPSGTSPPSRGVPNGDKKL